MRDTRARFVNIPGHEVYAHWRTRLGRNLGQGIHRTAYEFGSGMVLKVCSWSRATQGGCWEGPFESLASCPCVKEGYLQGVTGDEALAPIYAFGPCWVLMERAVEVARERLSYDQFGYLTGPARVRDAIDSLAVVLNQRYGMMDMHPGNVGRFSDGSWRALDFAL